MRISADVLDTYREQLDEQQRAAAKYVTDRLNELADEDGTLDTAQLRDDAIAIMEDAYRIYGDAASSIACDMYDQLCEWIDAQVDPAEVYNEWGVGIDDIDSTVRYQVVKARDGQFAEFVRLMAQAASNHARIMASKTTVHNATRARDVEAGVRFARVPTGVKTCGFCVVMASRGFDYDSREAAGDRGGRYNSFHDHCDCIVVAGSPGTTVDGYDPEWYQQVYEDAVKTLDCRPSDIDAIAKEINTRSADWVYRKKPGKATYEKPRENLLQHEKDGIDALLAKGFDVVALNEDNNADANIDFLINGQLWEMKNIGDGKHSIEDQMKRAHHKWEKLGETSPVRIVITSFGMTRYARDAIEEISRRMDRYADEVLFVSSDGKSMRRLKKQ